MIEWALIVWTLINAAASLVVLWIGADVLRRRRQLAKDSRAFLESVEAASPLPPKEPR